MATILKLADGIAVENDALRLTFPLVDGLIGKYSLYGRKQDGFQLAATVDPISAISYRVQDGATATENVVAAGYEMDRRGADCLLHLESEFHDGDGVTWTLKVEFYVPDQGPRITVTSRLSASRARQLVAFRGPFLSVPPDSKQVRRSAALLPGLDWVVGGERSSGGETAPSPFDQRRAPHPYKITVPAMAVSRAGLTVGLTWDPVQIWDGERVESSANRYPSAYFASPESGEGGGAHVMGLFLPSIPKFVDENALTAARPFQMTPGREITLECNLFVREGEDVGVSTREFVHLNGLIQPPPKARDYKESLELDVETYLDRAWSEKHAGWARSSSAEGKWSSYSELVALALWRASLFAKDEKLKHRIREHVETAVASHNEGPCGLAMAYFRGGFAEELDLQKGQLDKMVRTQRADGGWGAEDSVAGRRHETSLVGVTAEHAARVLRSGVLTGDPRHLEAGIKAIRFLDKFDRPSGLRVWDVHPHSPDLLVAAHLISAYLDEHLITGSPARLERAVYWAWTGLPFVYLWHAHNREVMRYATVPFFAVTLMDRKPWFGVAAQWNGLIYARELLRISRYDRSMRWHRIGRSITLCAMQLQRTGREGRSELTGFYPDAYNIVDGRDYYQLALSPQLITRNVLHLLGENVEPTCEVVPWREKRVRVATVAHMLAIRSSPHQLMVRLSYHAGETCYLTLAQCDRPKAVLVGEKPLPELSRLEEGRRGWQFDADRSLTVVRLSFDEPEEVLEFRL